MKNFINISDLSSKELRTIIEEAKSRKLNRKNLNKSAPDEDKPFQGKSMAMIFEKPSTRTRMSFDVAVRGAGFLLQMTSALSHRAGWRQISRR